jgi:hypothetical protein
LINKELLFKKFKEYIIKRPKNMENHLNERNVERNSSLNNNYNLINYSSTVRHIYLSLNDENNSNYKSKCTSITIDFSEISQDVSEVLFKNYYTYEVSVLVKKILNTDPSNSKMWHVSIKKKVNRTKY